MTRIKIPIFPIYFLMNLDDEDEQAKEEGGEVKDEEESDFGTVSDTDASLFRGN